MCSAYRASKYYSNSFVTLLDSRKTLVRDLLINFFVRFFFFFLFRLKKTIEAGGALAFSGGLGPSSCRASVRPRARPATSLRRRPQQNRFRWPLPVRRETAWDATRRGYLVSGYAYCTPYCAVYVRVFGRRIVGTRAEFGPRR